MIQNALTVFRPSHADAIHVSREGDNLILSSTVRGRDWELLTNNETHIQTNFPTDRDLRCSQKIGSCLVQEANTFSNGFHEYSHMQALYKHDSIMFNATSKFEIFPATVLLVTVT